MGGPHDKTNADLKKKKKEYEKKVAAIKESVKMRVPAIRVKIPELPPQIGTLGFEHLTHPFKPASLSPNILGTKIDHHKMAEKLNKMLDQNAQKEKAKKKKHRKLGTDNSDDSSEDDEETYTKKQALKNERFEDFKIPDVVDAETGEVLDLTRATWSTDEGRVNFDVQSALNRGAAHMKIKNRPNSSHRIVPIVSPRVVKKSKFQKAGAKVLSAVMLASGPRHSTEDQQDSAETEETTSEEMRVLQAQKHQKFSLEDIYRDEARKVHGAHGAHKYHMYDETKLITDDSAQYWRHTEERHKVHHFEHLIDGLTKKEIAEREYVSDLHHLHLKLKPEVLTQEHIHLHHHDEHKDIVESKGEFRAAKRHIHPLVASFIKDGPQQPMYHKFWDAKYDKVVLPDGWINDEDGDAGDYFAHYSPSKEDGAESNKATEKTNVLEDKPKVESMNSARSDDSSVGFESAETILKNKKHPDKKLLGTSGPLSSALEKMSKEGKELLKEGAALPIGTEAGEELSVLSDALDPENEVSWRALEDRYYFEIRAHALDYEANKAWTKEKATKGGVAGMDIACRKFANWKMRSMKFIVQAVDDEEKKEIARLALEDELEINKPERLLDQVKVHNEERHRHRTYIKTFKYDLEICILNKLNAMGLVW